MGVSSFDTVQMSALNLNGLPSKVSFSYAPGTANISEINITLTDYNSQPIDRRVLFNLWLSDAASGAGLTTVTASGAVTVKAGSGGTELQVLTIKKHFQAMTDAAGVYVLSITDTAKTGFYVATWLSAVNVIYPSRQLVTADYG